MMYLLDANALINAHRYWYALNRVPEFWLWLIHHAEAGFIKLPAEIYAEIEGGNDALSGWITEPAHRTALLLAEDSDLDRVQLVLTRYGDQLTDAEILKIGQDPFLVAAAYGHDDRVVVTAETSAAAKQRGNRKVPDICNDCGVPWRTPVQLINELDFTTSWNQ